MTTKALPSTPVLEHFVPETEPPVGTVSSFHYRFASGAGTATGFMMRGPGGWSSKPSPQRHDICIWESLTDLEALNADIQQRNPGSTAVFAAVEVRIHATPPVDRVGDRARLVKLEHAVLCAAERLGIQTDCVSHTELVAAIKSAAGVRAGRWR
ncbi:hypothetical protein [Arthrobacter terrae]|nr:hypothetical protein [Arthrobacter terrae]